nr:DUF1963 domain-containing protein [Sphingomonas sp. G-3-2-10]
MQHAGQARQRETVRRHERARASRPWIADHDALDALIARTGYAAFTDDLHRNAQGCVYFLDESDAPEAPPGTTRFGGLPDLSPGIDWPVSPAGAPLSFLAQIALEDITVPADSRLPASGLLSFFAGDWDTIDGSFPIRVLLHPAGAPLERRARPVEIDAFDCPHTADLHPVAARLAAGLSFPEYDIDWTGRIEEEAPDGADFDALHDGMSRPAPNLGQLLGHAPWTGDDLRAEIFFREIGRAGKERLLIWKSWEEWEGAKAMASKLANGTIYRPWSPEDDPHMRWILDHQAEIATGIARWQFLFAAESGVATNLWINDANAIYFFAPKDDLARGDFSRVQAVTTQS